MQRSFRLTCLAPVIAPSRHRALVLAATGSGGAGVGVTARYSFDLEYRVSSTSTWARCSAEHLAHDLGNLLVALN